MNRAGAVSLFKNLSLKFRLLVVIVAATLLASVLVTTHVVHLSRHQVENDQVAILATVARAMTVQLQQDILNRSNEISFISKLNKLTPSQSSPSEIQELLDSLVLSYPHYAWIGLVNLSGEVTHATDEILLGKNVAHRNWFSEGLTGVFFGDVHDAFLLASLDIERLKSDEPLRLVDIALPIYDNNNNVSGVIGAHLNIKWAFNLRDRILLEVDDPNVEIIVVSADGGPILNTFKNPINNSDKYLFQNLTPEQKAGISLQWPNGSEYLTVVQDANITNANFENALLRNERLKSEIGWTVIVRKPTKVALKTASELVNNILLITFVVVLILVSIVWMTLHRAIKPLEEAAAIADQIREDALDVPFPQHQGDSEIAKFSRSLTKLLNMLQLKNKDLALAEKIFSDNSLGIMITDERRNIIRVNEAFTRIIEYSEQDVLGQKPSILSSGKHDKEFFDSINRSLTSYGSWRGEIINRTKYGKEFPEWLTIMAFSDEHGNLTNYFAMFEDISTQKGIESKVEQLANYDILTNLPNRTFATSLLENTIEQYNSLPAEPMPFALIIVDIQRFKIINDTMGFTAGDELLKQISNKLSKFVKSPNFLARWGGDEFLIFAEDLEEKNAETFVTRLLRVMGGTFEIDEELINLSFSCGISLYPNDATDAASLIRCADVAVVHSKENKQVPFSFYNDSMNQSVIRYMEIEAKLRKAIETNFDGFELYYQPQFFTQNSTPKGVEALIRWRCESLGAVGPDVFIGILERNGMINTLGQWIINEACCALKLLEPYFSEDFSMSVNVSGIQLQNPDFCQQICDLTERHKVKRKRLIIEVTETAFTGDAQIANDTLSELKTAGFAISIDDFGTGYASLDYIQRFKPDEMKVDRVFVDKMLTDESCANIVKFTLDMAQSLGICVVAEGVETKEQLEKLNELGCPFVQGYLLAKPQALRTLIPAMQKHEDSQEQAQEHSQEQAQSQSTLTEQSAN